MTRFFLFPAAQAQAQAQGARVHGTYHEVNVRRAKHLAVHHGEQLSRRPVHGHRVGRRTEAVEGIAALGVGVEDAAEIVLLLVVVLLLVKAYACKLAF